MKNEVKMIHILNLRISNPAREAHQMKHKYRISAILLTMILCVTMLCAAFCFTEHTGHICAGESCSVCAVLEQCDQRIRCIASAAAAVMTMMLFTLCAVSLCIADAQQTAGNTPVTLKVKLLN